MLDLSIYHYVVKCNECEFSDGDYKTAEASAETHATDTGHALDVQVGGTYDG